MATPKTLVIIRDITTMPFKDHPPILRKDINDSEWTDAKAVLVPIMSIINVFMFFGNIVSIVTICYTPKLRQQVSYWFVMNLAVIDFVISVTVVPINTIWEVYGTWPFSRATCEFFTFADISFSTISAYSIVLVSIDKYMYISYSIHYYDKMTRKVCLIMIGTVWILVFVFATVSIVSRVGTDENFEDHFLTLPNNTHICVFVMTDTYVLPAVICSFFIPFVILCFTTSRITCIASKHIKKIHAATVSCASDTDSIIIRTSDKSRPRRHTFGCEEDANLSHNVTNIRKGHSEMNVLKEKEHPIFTIQEGNYSASGKIDIDNILNERKISQEMERKESKGNESVLTDRENCEKNGYINTTFFDEQEIIVTQAQTNKVSKSENFENNSELVEPVKPNIDQTVEEVETTTEKMEGHKNNNFGSENEGTKYKVCSKSETPAKQDKLAIQTSSDIDLQSEMGDDYPTRNRTESIRTYKLRKCNSIKSVLRKTSPYCKLFGTVTIVIICFIVMFAPYNIATVIDVPCHCIEPWVYEDILAVLYYMHSLVNPYIYMATDRKFKAALKILWRRVKMKVSGYFCT